MLDLLWASERKELRARSQCWTCSGRASERESRERGSNDDSAKDARVRPSQCLDNDDVLRTESAIYIRLLAQKVVIYGILEYSLHIICNVPAGLHFLARNWD
jgi:hypothetical protein